MQSKDEAIKKIASLVDRFEDQKDFYRKAEYNETLTRRDFIDPFFKALGWDIDNENGYAESYREVIHEDKIKIDNVTRAPDYSFRLVGGKRLFFVEAKKPSVLIRDEIPPAYQVRRYGWSAKLPVSIITDFEEFAVYDCTKKPNSTDKASTARLKYITYSNYLDEFDFIWNTFSKERVLKGSFDKFVQSDTYKKGTTTVDSEFLDTLNKWRTELAVAIIKKNKNISEEELNFVVQQTIDRIIFLRIAEDRHIEPYGNLRECLHQNNFYQNLFQLFVRADAKYNSGLFDFNKDKLSSKIDIDNKVIKTILSELYYPESPYEFAVLPVEILGTAYEQFLGKQIKIDSSNRVKIEEKPEVRKAGGVYYTPQHIVEYIVQHTIGKLIKDKNPKEISKIKIVDPACGSGSFLIGAYSYLLSYHKNYYTNNGKLSKGSKNHPLTPAGNLTTAEKKRILLNNIFGVDIDVNSVEVTKLSLLLKCIEGDTKTTLATQSLLFNERILPTLDNNIKSGNSLINTNYYDSEFDFGDDKKIKPFHWISAFPDIFKQDGFDVIIGNPPYVQPNILDKSSQSYLINNFKANTDLYSIFIEKSLELLKENNSLGFIVPSLFLKGVRYESLREVINTNCSHVEVKEYGDNVFEKVQMPTCVIILTKGKSKKNQNYFLNKNEKLFKKIKTLQLGSISETRRGLEIGRNKLFADGKIECITGGNLDKFIINDSKFISKDTFAAFSKDKDIFSAPKIMVRETGNKFFSTIDYTGILTTRSIYNTKILNKKYSTEFILGIINSSLFQFYFREFIAPDTNIFPKIRIIQLKELPIPESPDKNLAIEVERCVEQVLKLKNEIRNLSLQSQIEQLNAKIGYYEERINGIVFLLYGLTKEEVSIVKNRIAS